ncbi:hypothetical protein C1I97_22150 [Streptomyces sp. NTH33]|nr:hypothetical protein C1I97_22150 [Streptomyces sp. NTH33]
MVFSTEAQPLDVYRDPAGHPQLPTVANVLTNQTNRPVKDALAEYLIHTGGSGFRGAGRD